MTDIKIDEYVFSVDVEKTREYYKTHSVCNCVCCRNYYAQVKNKLPKLNEFLGEFGVDISRPDEVMSVEADGCIDYIGVDYTVCGSVKTMGEYKIDIYNSFLSIIITKGFACPNEQTGSYFTFSVATPIKLPWVLDEPIPKPIFPKPI